MSLTIARAHAENHVDARIPLANENDNLRHEIALLNEEVRIKDARMERFGALGKYGSLAVIERLIRSKKNECARLLPIVPLARIAFGREIDHYVAWFNAERPHSRFSARTPDELYCGSFPACRRPRFEPRARWPRRSPCAQPHALVRGRPGAVVELRVEHRAGRKHLTVVSLKRVA